MASPRTSEPAEIVYVPGRSWAPPFLAFGLALCLLGAYLWWPYAVVGGVIALAALRSWVRQTAAELDELPRAQAPVTDVVAPTTK